MFYLLKNCKMRKIRGYIRLFEGIKYVLPILHPNKKRLALIMCPEEDSASVEWARQKGENWVNKDITSLEFVENMGAMGNRGSQSASSSSSSLDSLQPM